MNPCPFCGARNVTPADVVGSGDYLDDPPFAVGCPVCRARGPRAESSEEAIAAWDRRALPTGTNGITGRRVPKAPKGESR